MELNKILKVGQSFDLIQPNGTDGYTDAFDPKRSTIKLPNGECVTNTDCYREDCDMLGFINLLVLDSSECELLGKLTITKVK